MHHLRTNRKLAAWFAAGVMLLASVVPTTAAADTDSDKWKFDADIYLWGAGIKGTTALAVISISRSMISSTILIWRSWAASVQPRASIHFSWTRST